MMEVEFEFHNAPDFAEIAEAAGINTTQILAAMNPSSDEVLVLWTATEEEDDPDMWSATFTRDADGILRQSQPTRRHEGWVDDMRAQIDRRMREHFGDPPGRP